jgi:hypothetical protein
MPRKRFTPAQANRTLPLVRRIVADILERGRELRRLTDGPLDVRARQVASRLQAELAELYLELERIGCSYKDWGFDMGLVDFPAELEGQSVLLCWRSDEPRVEWYHPLEAGFAGRRPIPPELLVQPPEGDPEPAPPAPRRRRGADA